MLQGMEGYCAWSFAKALEVIPCALAKENLPKIENI